MSSVILKEMSNQDIDWMLATGERVEIAPGTVLVEQGQTLDALYILLDGALTVTLNQENADPLGRAFAVLEGGIPGRKIAHLEKGEIIGVPLFENSYSSTTVCASKKSSVLMISNAKLMGKLHQDLNFAAHLYRAFAVMLANRLQQMMQELGRSTLVLSKPQLREALIIFSELHDSDIDWLIAAGQIQVFPSGSILIRSGRPTEALYILLDGAVALNACEDDGNALVRAFSNLEDSKNQPLEREFTRLSRGDIVGETPFIEGIPEAVTVKAVKDSRVLSIPRWRLSAKLLHDVSFAVRFYRVLAIILADKQTSLIQRLGYGRLTYSSDKSLDESFANELNNYSLTQMGLAGARFDWMLKRIRVN
ncbi:cyclic nucleotide-binding protein [Calothrix sp. NIES-4071]|nr:cyclic nucleotide-binding protein [Calothrix sp. NIES-4071]BAZ55355.1 cyclic nucleotide-binding protein [Calothrix sp. NIES-4105]